MDALFTAVDAGRVGARMENKNWRDRREATGARFSDLRLDFDEFRVALRRAATVRYPEAKDESRAYAALLRNHVLARCARTRIAHDRDLDELLSRESMNEVTSRDVALRRVYGHYATLHMFSATTQKINWRTVVRLNATLNEDEFLMFLVNFEVVPHLMSKSEAMTVFRETEEANDADGRAGEMLYPAFVELVGRLAVQAFANVAPMLRNPATDVTSIVAVKKLVEPSLENCGPWAPSAPSSADEATSSAREARTCREGAPSSPGYSSIARSTVLVRARRTRGEWADPGANGTDPSLGFPRVARTTFEVPARAVSRRRTGTNNPRVACTSTRTSTRENRPSNAREWNARVSSSWKRARDSSPGNSRTTCEPRVSSSPPVRPNDSSPREEPRATTRMPKTRTRPRRRRRRAFFANLVARTTAKRTTSGRWRSRTTVARTRAR